MRRRTREEEQAWGEGFFTGALVMAVCLLLSLVLAVNGGTWTSSP